MKQPRDITIGTTTAGDTGRRTTQGAQVRWDALVRFLRSILAPQIAEGIHIETLDDLRGHLKTNPKLQKLRRFIELEYRYGSARKVADEDDKTEAAVWIEYERMRKQILAYAAINATDTSEANMNFNSESFKYAKLSIEQLERLQREAGVYAMLPQKNRHVEAYQFPGSGNADLHGVTRDEAIAFDRDVLLDVLMEKAFNEVIDSALSSRSRSNGSYKTAAGRNALIEKAEAARVKVREWFPQVAIVDLGVVGHPTAEMDKVVTEIERQKGLRAGSPLLAPLF